MAVRREVGPFARTNSDGHLEEVVGDDAESPRVRVVAAEACLVEAAARDRDGVHAAAEIERLVAQAFHRSPVADRLLPQRDEAGHALPEIHGVEATGGPRIDDLQEVPAPPAEPEPGKPGRKKGAAA